MYTEHPNYKMSACGNDYLQLFHTIRGVVVVDLNLDLNTICGIVLNAK